MAHIALTAYELETGGISRVAIHIANSFCLAGHKVSLLLCSSAGDLDERLRKILHADVDYIAFDSRRHKKRIWGQIFTQFAFRKWLRANRPDILLGTSNNIAWFTGLGLLANSYVGSKLFIKTTNPIMREADGPLVAAIRRMGYVRLFGCSECVLTLSDAESQILQAQFPRHAKKFRSVFNPYLTEAFLENEPKASVGQVGPVLLAVGRLAEQKNIDRLIHAFAIARSSDAASKNSFFHNARLKIAGDGPYREALEKLVVDLGQSDAIEFLGFREDVPALLQEASMFVLSSNYEGLPAVIIEALGSNCPVVATDCFPAVRELLADLPGCVVTIRDAKALARGFLQSAAAPAIRTGLRERALNYSIDSAAQSHLAAMGL